MILVTVGTEQYPFNRLMIWLTELINDGSIQEEVIVQYGACTVLPPNVKGFESLQSDQFADLVRHARVVIGHCGEGTLLLLEEIGTPYILVPRSGRYKEHIDDHQVELARALQQSGAAIAWSPRDLSQFILAPQHVPQPVLSNAYTQTLCRKLHRRFSTSQEIEEEVFRDTKGLASPGK